ISNFKSSVERVVRPSSQFSDRMPDEPLTVGGECIQRNVSASVRRITRGSVPQRMCFMSNSAKQHPIRAIINFRTMTADAVVTAGVNIAGTVYNNPKFAGASPQPIDQPTLKAATDALVAANAAAVDGGKKAVQEQKHLKEVVVKFLTQLAHWAQANCKEDM